ncbi:MAG: hypothetical protein K2M36_00835, partial [Clostridia bacterium]|nr:hypothetical protein [Clostridia bacterium]
MKKTLTKRNVGRIFLLAAFVAILLSAVFLGVISYSSPHTENENVALADDPVSCGANATSGISSFTTTYDSNTINLTFGTPAASNIAWSAYSGHGQTYALDLGNGKFGVQKGGNYGGFNSYVAALNIEVPKWLQDLAASTTLSVKITGDYYCWRHRTLQDDAEFYFGVTQSSSLIGKPIDITNSSVRDKINEDDGNTFLPGYSSIHNQKIGTGTTATSVTGSYSATITLSSSSKYIGIGLSGHGDGYPGYATPESYMHNIKLSFTVDTTVNVKCNTNGKFSYYWYPDATLTSSGTAKTGTVTAGNSFSQKTTNPFAYVVVIPQEIKNDDGTGNGYRFQNVKISGTERTLGYDKAKDEDPKAVSISLFADSNHSGLTRNGQAYSYNYRQSTTASEVNFTAREYK